MYESMSETVAAYDDMLNETNSLVYIGSYIYDPADVLREIDPIAYKCGWIDWCDAEGIDTDELEDDYTFDRDRF